MLLVSSKGSNITKFYKNQSLTVPRGRLKVALTVNPHKLLASKNQAGTALNEELWLGN
jgi:hypothetical protein